MDAVTIIAAERAEHQWLHAQALLKGLRVHGIKARIPKSRHAGADTKVVACWGWRLGEMYRERGHEVLVMERGYIGDRFRYSSLGWNGLNGRARFPDIAEPSRFAQICSGCLKPWRSGGEYVLLVGQVPGDMSLAGQDLRQWYEDIARDAAEVYGVPVRFRPHPQAVERGYTWKVESAPTIDGSLQDALRGALVVITYNSNAAVDAVLAGVPAIAVDEGSMAWPVTAHVLTEIAMPARETWASRLAWCQWTLAEIATGVAWDVVSRCAPALAEAA